MVIQILLSENNVLDVDLQPPLLPRVLYLQLRTVDKGSNKVECHYVLLHTTNSTYGMNAMNLLLQLINNYKYKTYSNLLPT